MIMDGWMDGWMHAWTHGWMDARAMIHRGELEINVGNECSTRGNGWMAFIYMV